jgi:predicted RND superfamily exporter protein
MWQRLGQFILKYRIPLLVFLIGSTVFMGFRASRVQLSYDFARAIPINNPKYKAYQDFKQKFGEDGNLLVIGIQTDKFFQETIFNNYVNLVNDLK